MANVNTICRYMYLRVTLLRSIAGCVSRGGYFAINSKHISNNKARAASSFEMNGSGSITKR